MLKRKNKYGILYVQFTSNQRTKIMIEIDQYLKEKNLLVTLTYDFLEDIIKKEFDIKEYKYLKMRYLKDNIFYLLDKDFKMSLEIFNKNDLVLLVNYRMKNQIEGIKIKSLEKSFSKKLNKLNETFKERFLLLDFFFFSSKKDLSLEDKNFLQQFYSNGEYNKLLDIIK